MSTPTARLGEIASLQAGIGFPPALQGRTTGDFPFAKVGDISRCGRSASSVLSAADHYVDQADVQQLRAKLTPAGSILFAKIGEAIRQNHRVVAGCDMLIDNNAMAVIPSDRVDGRFLYNYLKTVDFYALAPATTVPALRKSELETLRVPLPPLEEQRRIAVILDQAETLRTQRRQALAHLDTLTQSLFLDMFGDPATNPMGWDTLKVEQLADQVTDGEHLTPRRELAGIKLLSARNVRDGFIDFKNVDFIGQAEHDRIKKRCNPVRGDVLISCSGSIGRVSSVETEEPFSLVRSVAMIRPKADVVHTKFLEHFLRTPSMNAYMIRRANASSQANLFQGPIREMPVVVPPMLLQQTFVARIQAIEALKATHRTALAQLDALFASLQQRAFNGEL